MVERMTKSYEDKCEDINLKIAELESKKSKIEEKANEYYPKAGAVLFAALDVDNLVDLKKSWNKRVPEDMQVKEFDCDVEMPVLDTGLMLRDKKKFEKMYEKYIQAAEVHKAAAGEAISNILHVSLVGDLNKALIELGIIEGVVEGVITDSVTKEEVVEEEIIEDTFAENETMSETEDNEEHDLFSEDTVEEDSGYNPYQ